MFDNALTLNPSTHLTGATNANMIFDRVTPPSGNAGLFRVSGTAVANPHTVLLKHEVRKGKGYDYQASSMKLSHVQNDTITGKKVQFDVGFYLNMPIGTFVNEAQMLLDLAGRCIALARDPNFLNKMKNQET